MDVMGVTIFTTDVRSVPGFAAFTVAFPVVPTFPVFVATFDPAIRSGFTRVSSPSSPFLMAGHTTLV